MIVTNQGDIVYNLAQLFAIRNTKLGSFVKVLRLLAGYLCWEGIHPYPDKRYMSTSLKQMLDDGWVGSVMVDKTQQQLLGIMLARVHFEDGLVVGSVLRYAVRKSRTGDMEVSDERKTLLGQALRDQVVEHYFFEASGWRIDDQAILSHCMEELFAGRKLDETFLYGACTDMSLFIPKSEALHMYIWDSEKTCLVPVVG